MQTNIITLLSICQSPNLKI